MHDSNLALVAWDGEPGAGLCGAAHRGHETPPDRGPVLVGHVTKENETAGPRVRARGHNALSFGGDRHHALRLLRALRRPRSFDRRARPVRDQQGLTACPPIREEERAGSGTPIRPCSPISNRPSLSVEPKWCLSACREAERVVPVAARTRARCRPCARVRVGRRSSSSFVTWPTSYSRGSGVRFVGPMRLLRGAADLWVLTVPGVVPVDESRICLHRVDRPRSRGSTESINAAPMPLTSLSARDH